MNSEDPITVDPDVLGGTPVFKGTRVPVKTLFEYLEDHYTLDEFLECFPTVTRDQARRALERSASMPPGIVPLNIRIDPETSRRIAEDPEFNIENS